MWFFIDIALCREYIININTHTPMGIKRGGKDAVFKKYIAK